MAVVSRGGRPDLAGDDLSKVIAPVLLIVGENDPQVIDLNEWALFRLNAQSKLEMSGRDTLIRRARSPGIGCAPSGQLVSGSCRFVTEYQPEKRSERLAIKLLKNVCPNARLECNRYNLETNLDEAEYGDH